MSKPPLGGLTSLFLRVGNTTFGGGDPTMAVLQRELVERRGWLDAGQYALSYSLARITPGTNVLAFCAGAGWMMRGWPGAVAAVIAASLPSAALAVWLLAGYQTWRSVPWVASMVAAIVAAVVGMMAAAILTLARPQFRIGGVVRTLALVAGTVLLTYVLEVSPVAAIALVAAVGFLWKEKPAE